MTLWRPYRYGFFRFQESKKDFFSGNPIKLPEMKLYYLYSREDAERDADEDEAEHEHVVQDFQPATQM